MMKGYFVLIARVFMRLAVSISALGIISCQFLSQTAELVKPTPSTASVILASPSQSDMTVNSPSPLASEAATVLPSITSTSESVQQTSVPSPQPLPSISAIPSSIPTLLPLLSPAPVQIGPRVYKITIHNNYSFPLLVYIDEKYIMTIPGRRYMWFQGVLEGLHIVYLCPWQAHCIKKIISFDEDKELWIGP
jgi:hypothetical protein